MEGLLIQIEGDAKTVLSWEVPSSRIAVRRCGWRLQEHPAKDMFSHTDELESWPVVATAEDTDCRHLKPDQEEHVTKSAADISRLSGLRRRVLDFG